MTNLDFIQEDVWVEVKPNLLTPAEALAVRRSAKFWRVWRHEARRSVLCRICGETIPAGMRRLGFKHVDITARVYDKQGFVHSDERICQQNLELESYFDQQMLEAEGIGFDESSQGHS